MKRYTLKVEVDHGHTETIWSGDDINEAHHYESIGIKHWGREAVWICDNLQEVMHGRFGYSNKGSYIYHVDAVKHHG